MEPLSSNRQSTTVADESLQLVEPFSQTLARHRLELKRGQTTTLQINCGLLCNQTCKHCHLEAGPGRPEVMDKKTIEAVIAFARRGHFDIIDITGGAPELNENLVPLVEGVTPLAPRVILRSNLTALHLPARVHLLDLCSRHRLVIIASLPSPNIGQVESQRGRGVWEESIFVLKKLNARGYGQEGSGLELDLVANPAGAYLPASQAVAEKKFKSDLWKNQGVIFNNLYTFANVPLGRFRSWLMETGNFETYMQRLATSFNPCTIDRLMCRTLVSVSWDGYLCDCDFNQAAGLFLGEKKTHITEMKTPLPSGTPIAVADHCYACTAGPGFT
jgi:radical SAM/Cys-rich protein